MKEYKKISGVKTNHHIYLTIDGVEVDIDRDHGVDVDYAVSVHNEMVDRIEYLEGVAAKFLAGENPDTQIKRVRFHEGCWSGDYFDVITGHGELPKAFSAISDDGIKVIARLGTKMIGGGHGEGSAFATLSYNVTQQDGDKYYNFNGKFLQ